MCKKCPKFPEQLTIDRSELYLLMNMYVIIHMSILHFYALDQFDHNLSHVFNKFVISFFFFFNHQNTFKSNRSE